MGSDKLPSLHHSVSILLHSTYYKPTMIPLLLLLSTNTQALPFPQLTAQQFSARARSLDFPPAEKVFIVNGYSNVRRQGRMGSQENIKYPQLVVKDPNELLGGYSKNSLLTNGPVYDKETKEEKESTARIQEQINAINDDLINKLEALEEVDGVQDLIDIEKLTDITAAEIVAEELAQNIESIVDLKVSDEALKKDAEDMAHIIIDGEIVQLTKEIVENEIEEIAEKIETEVEEVEADLVEEAVAEIEKIIIENDNADNDEEKST